MKTASEAMEQLVATAAELRAAGLRWESVAAKVGRSPETCRRWPSWYPELWQRLYARARADAVAEAGAEARAILRIHLRSKDEKVALAAAKILAAAEVKLLELQLRMPEPPRETSEWEPFIEYMESLTDEQREALGNNLMEKRLQEREQKMRAAAEAAAAQSETLSPALAEPEPPPAPAEPASEPPLIPAPTPPRVPPTCWPVSPAPAVAASDCFQHIDANIWNADAERREQANPLPCRNRADSSATAGPAP